MASVWKDYDFFINYGIEKNLVDVYNIYKTNISKLNFYNNLQPNWGLITLAMLKEVTTPYVIMLCEDFEFKTTYDEWNNIFKEAIDHDVIYIPIGRLWKYTQSKYCGGYINGKNIWLYKAEDSPGSSLSVDAVYKTELLIEKLEELQKYNTGRFPINLPHHFEDIFHEPNGVTLWEDKMCAIPKKIVLMHIQLDTETKLNK